MLPTVNLVAVFQYLRSKTDTRSRQEDEQNRLPTSVRSELVKCGVFLVWRKKTKGRQGKKIGEWREKQLECEAGEKRRRLLSCWRIDSLDVSRAGICKSVRFINLRTSVVNSDCRKKIKIYTKFKKLKTDIETFSSNVKLPIV